MTLTKEDARTIAKAFQEAAEAVDAYLDANFRKIDRAEYEFLNESFKTLLRVSSFAITVAVGLSIQGLKKPETELKEVILKAKEKIDVLKSIRRTIRLVASLTDLAAGIMAKDPNAIVSAVTTLNKELQISEDE